MPLDKQVKCAHCDETGWAPHVCAGCGTECCCACADYKCDHCHKEACDHCINGGKCGRCVTLS